ncbi:MAG: hypothetical protein WB681_10320 [Candidatus Cybelea sp.]
MSVTAKPKSTSTAASEDTSIKCECTESGDLVLSRDGKKIARIGRSGISAANLTAITNFQKSVSELRSIDEWVPGEKVIADRSVALRDTHGLPFTVLRGQALDERDLIEQCLKIEGPQRPRLLRKGAELETETIMREALTLRGQEGLAQSALLQKRILQSVRGA